MPGVIVHKPDPSSDQRLDVDRLLAFDQRQRERPTRGDPAVDFHPDRALARCSPVVTAHFELDPPPDPSPGRFFTIAFYSISEASIKLMRRL